MTIKFGNVKCMQSKFERTILLEGIVEVKQMQVQREVKDEKFEVWIGKSYRT